MPAYSSEPDHRRIYRKLLLIRRAEEEIARIYPSDKIKSPVHLSIGQEAAAVGVCDGCWNNTPGTALVQVPATRCSSGRPDAMMLGRAIVLPAEALPP